MDKLSYLFSLFMMFMMVLGIILFNLSPMYNNYKNGAFSGHISENATLEYSIYYYFPGFSLTKNFNVITIVNVYFSYCCGAYICVFDLYVTLIIIQIIGHIKILRNNLERLSCRNDSVDGSKKWSPIIFNDDENKNVHYQLIDCIEHHKLIVTFTNEMSDFFGPIFAFTYLFHLFACCLLLLECSQSDPNAIARYGPLTLIIFGELFQLSIMFEVVGVESEKLFNDLYAVAWERMSLKNRRTMCIMLNRVQTPIEVTAMGMTTVGVRTMAGILKTTFSYYTFLRSMNK